MTARKVKIKECEHRSQAAKNTTFFYKNNVNRAYNKSTGQVDL